MQPILVLREDLQQGIEKISWKHHELSEVWLPTQDQEEVPRILQARTIQDKDEEEDKDAKQVEKEEEDDEQKILWNGPSTNKFRLHPEKSWDAQGE